MAKRTLSLDIFDYSGNLIVNLYDSTNSMSGEAVDIHRVEERNGWKELSFTLPSMCIGEDGKEEENYRLKYLVADYKIRFKDDKETDWYLISEPKITHDNFSKTVEVVAGHIAQLLKTKKMSLEFSDEEGNNVGTASELLECVLEGTDWEPGEVYDFRETYENDNSIKKRSLVAGTKTGAFKLIEMICELFDAKPRYRCVSQYDSETGKEIVKQYVDVVPMNPFSKDATTDNIPDDVSSGKCKVFELNYNRNLKNISRTLNTDNMVTKLYAYGSYGDRSGLCSIQTCTHKEYIFTVAEEIEEGHEWCFNDSYGATYYFINTHTLAPGTKLIWSNLDFTSRTYIWNDTERYAYRIYKTPKTTEFAWLRTKCDNLKYVFTVQEEIPAESEVFFTDSFDNAYYFTTGEKAIPATSKITWVGYNSEKNTYVRDSHNKVNYDLYDEPKTSSQVELTTRTSTKQPRIEDVQNLFPYLLNFTYYDQVGLIDEEKFQRIATFQRRTPELYDECVNAATNFINRVSDLSTIGNTNTGFLRLAVSGYTTNQDDKSTRLTIKLNEGEKGVLFRSDYLNNRKNWFSWHVAKDLKPNGDPVTGSPSWVLIVHNTDPITWEKAYVKEIYAKDKDGTISLVQNEDEEPIDFHYGLEDEETNPCELVLWAPMSRDSRNRRLPAYSPDDQFFLFCTYSQSGEICGLEVQEEAIINSEIKTSIGSENEVHPVYFMDGRPGIDTIPTTSVVGIENQFGWYYKYDFTSNKDGELFFCGKTDITWHPVTVSDKKPNNPAEGDYFFDSVYRTVSVYIKGEWVDYEASSDEKKIAQNFSQVLYYCHKRDELYKGSYDYYYHLVDGEEYGKPLNNLPAGRYAIPSNYDYYWTFTTTQSIAKSTPTKQKLLKLDTQNKYIYQDDDVGHIVTAKVVPKYVTQRMKSNIIAANTFSQGWIDVNNGVEISLDEFTKDYNGYRSPYIRVYPGQTYFMKMPKPVTVKNTKVGNVLFYDANKNFRNAISVSRGMTLVDESDEIYNIYKFTVPKANTTDITADNYLPDAENIRIIWGENTELIVSGNPLKFKKAAIKLYMENYDKKMYLNDNTETLYTILSITDHGENLLGLVNLMARFVNAANAAYYVFLPEMEEAQNEIKEEEASLLKTLGPVLREGYWQDDSYVEGDEIKLYSDAMDNLEVVAQPEATYNITFLDQYGSNEDNGYSIDDTTDGVQYRDIEITDAVHLVDEEIDVNCWAYLDKVDICYDKPWDTSIEINTRLSLIGQHDFTDVLSSIAEVAKTTKAKQSIYDKVMQYNGIDDTGNFAGVVVEGANYEGVRVYGADFDGVEINGANYQGVWPEGANFGGVTIDGESYGGVTIDDKPIEGVVIHGANISGLILSGADFTGAITSGIVTADTIGAKVKEQLEHIFATENVKIQNTYSHWYTSDDGDLIFEALGSNGQPVSAIKIGGTGIFGASGFDPVTGWYDWKPFISGSGITADCITTGHLMAALIEGASISVNQLKGDTGQLLDISSNVGLDLYATTDGSKPTGSLKTSDAMIEIHSAITPDTHPGLEPDKYCDHAQINIASGGELNLSAGPEVLNFETRSAFPQVGQLEKLYHDVANDEYYIWNGSEYVESTGVGSINIKASRAINIESAGALNLKSDGKMLVEGGAGVDVLSGGAINIQSGAEEGVAGELNLQSTGTLNALANSEIRVAAGITSSDGVQYYRGESHTKFTPTFKASGAPNNFKYDSDGYAVTTASTPENIYYKDGNDYKRVKGGKVTIESANGIDVLSGGSITIASGAEEGVDGKVNIRSTGAIDIESGGVLTLRSAPSGGDGGKISIQSTGKVEMLSGSSMEIGVGTQENTDAKLLIGSTGDLEINGNGELRLTSVIDNNANIYQYGYSWPKYSAISIAKGEVLITKEDEINKALAYNAAVEEIETRIKAWYNGVSQTEANKKKAQTARSTLLSQLQFVLVDSNGNKYSGGKIIVESENGIDVKSTGSINIGSGAQQSVNGTINIQSTGMLNIGSNAELRIDAGQSDQTIGSPIPGKMTISSTGEMHLEAGSLMTLGVGTTGNTDAKLEIGSTGEIDILANGEMRLAAGDSAVSKYGYSWSSFPATGTAIISAGQTSKKNTVNEAYTDMQTTITDEANGKGIPDADKENAIRRVLAGAVLHSYDSKSVEVVGGKIIVESTNGIDLKSGGTLNISSGATGTINGNINIMSTGQMMIGANAELLIAAGGTNNPGGKITVDSTGLIDMKAGSEFKLGVGTAGDMDAKMSIGSTGSIDILANGKLRLAAGVTSDGVMTYYYANGATYSKFTPTFNDDGSPKNFVYNADGNAERTTGALLYYKKTDGTYALVHGGEIIIESTNGIEVKSHGTIKIGSGSGTSTDGKIEIGSTGAIDIKANGELNLTGGAINMNANSVFTVHSNKFNIDKNGNVTMEGKITATTGNIAGWEITGSSLYHRTLVGEDGSYTDGVGMTTGSTAFYAGRTFTKGTGGEADVTTNQFTVTKAGKLTANDAVIYGAVHAKSLYIGNEDTRLKCDSSGFMVENSVSDVGAAIKSTAGIKVDATTGIVIQATGNNQTNKVAAITLDSKGKIAISSTDVGQSSSGVYITPTSIKISTGTFELDSDYFDVATDGTITATKGTIGGWTITSNCLANGTERTKSSIGFYKTTSTSNANPVIWVNAPDADGSTDGTKDLSKSPFRVLSNGKLYATDATIEGIITAKSGGTIAGWKIGSSTIYKYQYDEGDSGPYTNGVGIYSGGSYAFYAGRTSEMTSINQCPFYVTPAGKLVATNISVTGGGIGGSTAINGGTAGGWTISASHIGDGASATNSTTGLYHSSSSGDTAFFAGHTAGQSKLWDESKFAVKHNGAVKASDITITGGSITLTNSAGTTTYFSANSTGASIRGAVTATSGTIGGVTIDSSYGMYTNTKTSSTSTKTGFLISKDGAIYLGAYESSYSSCKFQVTSEGALTARSGSVGGWSIGAKKLSSGSGTKYVALDSGDNADFAIWCGKESPGTTQDSSTQNAPFRVTRTGDVYINSLKVWNGTTWETIDFSGNFSNAVSLKSSGSWSGNTFTATVRLWGKIDKNIRMTGSVELKAVTVKNAVYAAGYGDAEVTLALTVNGATKPQETLTLTGVANATAIYKNGWSGAASKIGVGYAGETELVVPTANYGGDQYSTTTFDITPTFDAGADSVSVSTIGYSDGKAKATLSTGKVYSANLPSAGTWDSPSNPAAHALTVSVTIGGKKYSQSWSNISWVNS